MTCQRIKQPPITVYPAYGLCGKLARRTITVTGSGMVVSSVRTNPLPSGDAVNCPAGGWQDQSPSKAAFRGAGEARIELVPDTGPAPTVSSSQVPLLGTDQQTSALLTAIEFAVFTSIPLFLAWFRLRPHQRSRDGEDSPAERPEMSLRRWSSTNMLGSRTATVLAMFLILHVLVGVALVLSFALNSLNNRLFWPVDDTQLLTLTPPGAVVPAALMVALAFVWRRVALREVLDGAISRSGPAVDVGWITVASAALLTVTGVVWQKVGAQFLAPPAFGGGSWLLTRPGFLLVFIGALHLAALVGVLVAKRLGASPRVLSWVAWGAPLAMTLGFFLVFVQGVVRIPPDDGTAPDTWVSWLATDAGAQAVVFTVLAGLGIGVAVLGLRHGPSPHLGRRSQVLWWLTLPVLVTIISVPVLTMVVFGTPLLFDPDNWTWLRAEPSWSEWYHGWFGHLTALYLALLAAALGIVLLGRTLRLRPRTILIAVAGVVLVSVLLLVEPITTNNGLLGTVVGAAVPLTASVFVWPTLDRIVRHAVNTDPPESWRKWRPRLRRWRGLRVAVALVLSVPLVVYGGAWAPPISWYDFSGFASSVDNALPLVGLFLLILLTRHLGLATPNTLRGSPRLLREVAVLVVLVGILGPSVTAARLPIAFLVGWLLVEVWLLPRASAGTEHPAMSQAAQDATRAAVQAVVRDAVTARAETALEKELRQKLAEDTPTKDVQNRRLRRITDLTLGERRTSAEQRHLALSSYGGHTAWQRARQFAVIGFTVGLPWTMLDVAAVINTLTGGGPYRLIDAATGALVILRFAIAGLVLGGAYPFIRGATGLGKGFNLFIAMTGPALCVTLLPNPSAHDALASALLQLTQWLSFGLVLGLTADWLTLRRHGYTFRHLRELHRLNTLTASASTLLLAVLTAIVTAAGTSAAGIFVDRMLTPPPAAPAPPSNQDNTG